MPRLGGSLDVPINRALADAEHLANFAGREPFLRQLGDGLAALGDAEPDVAPESGLDPLVDGEAEGLGNAEALAERDLPPTAGDDLAKRVGVLLGVGVVHRGEPGSGRTRT